MYNRKGLILKTARIKGGIEDLSKRVAESNNQLCLLKFSIFVTLSQSQISVDVREWNVFVNYV